MKDLFEKIWQIAGENPEGFTVSLPDCKPVTAGIAIGHSATQNSFGKEGLRKVIKHSLSTTSIVGGWLYDGHYYFDTVIITDNVEEALKLKSEHKQIAIYWIEKSQVL